MSQIAQCCCGCLTAKPLGEPTIAATNDKRCAWLGLPETWLASA